MGIAASQARYLALTARKSNIEFQGQQINQQRTTLANESSSFNSRMLSLSVPTAPSSADFTKTSYTFSMGNKKCSISGPLSLNDKPNASGEDTYTVNYTTAGTGDVAKSINKDYSRIDTTAGGEVSSVYKMGNTTLASTDDGDIADLQTIFGDNYKSDKEYFKYSPDGGVSYRYVSKDAIDDIIGGPAEPADEDGAETIQAKDVPTYYVTEGSVNTESSFSSALVNWNESGRMTSINVNGVKYDLSATTTTDDAAYKDAMNQYGYDKQVYEKELNDINANLEIVQQQDKTLELQLTQLDTEQKAVSTEEEAVKKVLEKNAEAFKTFA